MIGRDHSDSRSYFWPTTRDTKDKVKLVDEHYDYQSLFFFKINLFFLKSHLVNFCRITEKPINVQSHHSFAGTLFKVEVYVSTLSSLELTLGEIVVSSTIE